MNTEQTQKIKAVSIWLNRAEGPTDECGQVEFSDVNVWQRADMMLRAWSETAPQDGRYHKTDFKVTYADGETYTGRLDMKHWSVQVPSVAGHMRSFVTFHAGRVPEAELPAHMKEGRYAQFLARIKDDVESFANFLDQYEIG